MKEISLAATRRDESGKGIARRTRRAGRIPAVVYGPEIDPVGVAVDERAFRAALKTSGTAAIFNLDVEGDSKKVIIREIQRDPVTSDVVHLDFHAISMNKPIHMAIPIRFVGESAGVKLGGIQQTTMRELDVSCLPTEIPDTIEIDVTELGIGDSVHVRELDIPKVNILSEEQRTIVVISAPTVIVEPVTEEEDEEGIEAAEGAEGAEGEAAAEGEGDAKAKAEGDKPAEKK
ncbi:MAG: 50S ribosomal protein L25, partial [candidate division Zixibacteria bacterium]